VKRKKGRGRRRRRRKMKDAGGVQPNQNPNIQKPNKHSQRMMHRYDRV
jgi:hypothetical protein